MIARSPPRSRVRAREGNEHRSPAVEFSVDVAGIIISQLINVHIIISEDAGSSDEAREKGAREKERQRGMEMQLHRGIGISVAYTSFSFVFD